MGDYFDRLDVTTYTEDPIVAVHRDDPVDGLDVPERVFWRLVHVAKGYTLHLLPLLGDSDPVRLNRPMIRNSWTSCVSSVSGSTIRSLTFG